MPGGRPEWIPPDLNQVKQLAARGLNEAQIAACLGIAQYTLIRKKKQYSEFCEAIKAGQAEGIAQVSNWLFQSAKGGSNTAQIFYLKCRAGWREAKPEDEDTGTPPPVTINFNVRAGDNGAATPVPESEP